MKDRLISLVGALLALYVVVILFVNPQVSDFVEFSYPTSEDRGENGLKGLYQWLQQSEVPVYQLRRRYSNLNKLPNVGESGNLMIISLPQKKPAHDLEMDSLLRWLKQGNNLLILAARSDAHLNKKNSFSKKNNLLQRIGFRFQVVANDKSDKSRKQNEKIGLSEMKENFGKEISIELSSRAGHPVTIGINKVQGRISKLSSFEYSLVSTSSFRSTLVLLEDKVTSEPAFWEARYENSRLWISRFSFLFSNAQLGRADNSKLVANIINASVARGGKVIFDDMHQGSTELYDEDAFFSDSRLHTTLWFIFSFWVLYVVGHTNRIAPLAVRIKPAKVSEYIHAMANLFARRLSKIGTAKLLFNHFFDWVRLKYSMPTNGQPVWKLLEGTEKIDKTDLDKIKQSYMNIQNNRKVNLTKLVNRIQKIRSALS